MIKKHLKNINLNKKIKKIQIFSKTFLKLKPLEYFFFFALIELHAA
jgi:hypothetical protein